LIKPYNLTFGIDPEGLGKRGAGEVDRGEHALIIQESVTSPNAGRSTKIPGTWACKGQSTHERPHRISGILLDPDELLPSEWSARATLTMLQAIIDDNPDPKKVESNPKPPSASPTDARLSPSAQI
jgi:hypothetical protein